MKTKLLLLLSFITLSCSTPDSDLNYNKVNQSITKPTQLAIGCGTIYSAQTLFTGGTTSVFIGVRYDLVLGVPQSGFTKAYFVLNDALNTATTNQYYTNGQVSYVCRNDLILY